MRTRCTGAILTAIAILFTVSAGQSQQRAPQPQPGGQASQAQRGAQVQRPQRPDRILGKPNLNGIWQALNTAYWNLEGHSAEGLDRFWQLGAIASIPAGRSVVRGGTIPYLPEALKKRNENRAKWPEADPEAKCYMLGIPRSTYHDFPFQVFRVNVNLHMDYSLPGGKRIDNMKDHSDAPDDSWMGKS